VVTVPVRRTFPSGAARPSPHTGVSSRPRSNADRPRRPNGPRTPGTLPHRHRPARRPSACATGVPYATAWHDMPTNRTKHQAVLPASAVRHKPDSSSPRSARCLWTPRQRRTQSYSEPGIRNSYSQLSPGQLTRSVLPQRWTALASQYSHSGERAPEPYLWVGRRHVGFVHGSRQQLYSSLGGSRTPPCSMFARIDSTP
jgi:hypothetical protein